MSSLGRRRNWVSQLCADVKVVTKSCRSALPLAPGAFLLGFLLLYSRATEFQKQAGTPEVNSQFFDIFDVTYRAIDRTHTALEFRSCSGDLDSVELTHQGARSFLTILNG